MGWLFGKGKEEITVKTYISKPCIKIFIQKGEKIPQNTVEEKGPVHLISVIQNSEDILLSDIKIFGKHINKGYGTLLLSELIKYAKENNFKKIHGNITQVDWNHITRLRHFYSKFGFEIKLDETKKEGIIVLNLK